MSDGTGVAEALLGLPGFRVLEVPVKRILMGQPVDTAGFSDEPAATQSSVTALITRLDTVERRREPVQNAGVTELGAHADPAGDQEGRERPAGCRRAPQWPARSRRRSAGSRRFVATSL